MKRCFTWTSFVSVFLLAASASAEHLEIGLAATPTFILDESYEALSSDEHLAIGTFGVDIRSQLADVRGFQFALFLGYRFGSDTGTMYNALDTEFFSHDFRLGLRVRKDIISWLGIFAEAYGGVLLGYMNGTLNTASYYLDNNLGLQDTYEDHHPTWSAGGQIGLEMHFSRAWLASKNIKRFCFGGELGVGYSAHGDLEFDPTLSGGGGSAVETQSLGKWGSVNTSGITFQIAGSVYFF